MSQATQIALAGPGSVADPAHPSAITRPNQRQSIPRFLLQINQIVNDPANEHLIKWSEAGDSFYIFNQERFAREILRKWFKHDNFSSFVRQLNLYGFRKIPTLQRGLLRMDSENEAIQFGHPHFHRGQPDLLALIQRRRHPASHTQGEDSAVSSLQSSISQDSQGQNVAVDVRAIVDGINTIRRQQQAISADLTALKQSNDALWKEAIEARERHAKHEDTINRILKFLAGLFGRAIEGQQGKQLRTDGKAPPARRLMIGDGRTSNGEDEDYFDLDGQSDGGSRSHTPLSVASERFATIETPNASITSPAPTINEVPDSLPKSPLKQLHIPSDQIGEVPKFAIPSRPSDLAPTAPSVVTGTSEQNGQAPDPILQTTIQQMLNTPGQYQRMLQAFLGAHPYDLPNDGGGVSLNPSTPGIVPPQQVAYPTPILPAQPQSYSYPYLTTPADPLAVSTKAPVAPDPMLLTNTERLNKAYQDTAEIHADMDALQSNIHSLVRDIGLDPNNIAFPGVDANHAAAAPLVNSSGGLDTGGQDFSFDTWLNEFASNGDLPDLTYPPSSGNGDENMQGGDMSSFLDLPSLEDVPTSLDLPASSTSTQGMDQMPSPSGVKRKIEVIDVPDSSAADAPSTKKKR